MERDYSVERFITFADAVVAIAITLLALPLLELSDRAEHGFATWWDAAYQPLIGLLVSFFVIGRLWWSHHRIYSHVVRLRTPLVVSTFLWLLTIVLVSIATSITTSVNPFDERHRSVWAFALYVGVMIASGLTLFAQSLIVLRDRTSTDGRDDDALRRVVASGETVIGFALALVIGVLVPWANYFSFFVLALTGRFDRPLVRRLERRRARRQPVGEQERRAR